MRLLEEGGGAYSTGCPACVTEMRHARRPADGSTCRKDASLMQEAYSSGNCIYSGSLYPA